MIQEIHLTSDFKRVLKHILLSRSIFYLIIPLLLISCSPKPSNKKELSKSEKVNGVWIASPEHNTLMHSYKNIENGISELNRLGINTLFVCTWAQTKTAYKSKVLLKNTNYKQLDSTDFFASYHYKSASNDPLADLISEAHKYNMKVIFWFEYGFMANWGETPTVSNNPILAKHPNWIGINNKGETCNYNNSDYYFNSYHPEVQKFILSLIEESLDLYPEVDGIQGDDRLPASPVNSGYDANTKQKYQEEHHGNLPPLNYRDEKWVQWRLNKLNDFAVEMHDLIKSKNKDYLMSFSPNPYPWCKENLMQDWPSWINLGIVDLISVQCYRKNLGSYKKTIDQTLTYMDQEAIKNIFIPGIILGIGSGKITEPESLDSILKYNQQLGLKGQSYFYSKWLLESQEFKEVVEKY